MQLSLPLYYIQTCSFGVCLTLKCEFQEGSLSLLCPSAEDAPATAHLSLCSTLQQLPGRSFQAREQA